MKIKKKRIAVVLVLFGVLFGDRLIAQAVFEYHCDNNMGVFIYEKIELDESYFVPIPDDVRKRDSQFNISDIEMIDKERIEREYEIYSPIFEVMSEYGPVQSIKTQIIRKLDKKLMGEVVTFRSYYGWTSRLVPAVNLGKDCPISVSGPDANLHYRLYKEIFNFKKEV